MFLEGRKMKKFKMARSTKWPKERNQAKQRYIRLQKEDGHHQSSDKFMAREMRQLNDKVGKSRCGKTDAKKVCCLVREELNDGL